jgi:hypothetical protein
MWGRVRMTQKLFFLSKKRRKEKGETKEKGEKGNKEKR